MNSEVVGPHRCHGGHSTRRVRANHRFRRKAGYEKRRIRHQARGDQRREWCKPGKQRRPTTRASREPRKVTTKQSPKLRRATTKQSREPRPGIYHRPRTPPKQEPQQGGRQAEHASQQSASVTAKRWAVTFLFLVAFSMHSNHNVFQIHHKTVILRACDFFVFCIFDAPNHNVFKTHHKTVILSEAPRRSIA